MPVGASLTFQRRAVGKDDRLPSDILLEPKMSATPASTAAVTVFARVEMTSGASHEFSTPITCSLAPS